MDSNQIVWSKPTLSVTLARFFLGLERKGWWKENSFGVLEVLDSWLHMSQCAASDLLPLALFKVLIKPAEQVEVRLNHLSKIKLVNKETQVHSSHKTAGSMLECWLWFIIVHLCSSQSLAQPWAALSIPIYAIHMPYAKGQLRIRRHDHGLSRHVPCSRCSPSWNSLVHGNTAIQHHDSIWFMMHLGTEYALAPLEFHAKSDPSACGADYATVKSSRLAVNRRLSNGTVRAVEGHDLSIPRPPETTDVRATQGT